AKGIVAMKRRSPTWFFFALLTGVFVMSLLAPLAWNRARPIAVRTNPDNPNLDPREVTTADPSPNAVALETAAVELSHHTHRLTVVEPAIEQPAPPVADLIHPDLNTLVAPLVQHVGPPSEDTPFTLSPPQATTEASAAVEPALHGGWVPMPEALLAQLDNLAKVPQAQAWAVRLREQVVQLTQCKANDRAQIAKLLAALSSEVEAAEPLTAKLPSEQRQSDLRRAAFALSRRLTLWNGAHDMAHSATAARHPRDRKGTETGAEDEEPRRFPRVSNFLTPRNDARHHERIRTESATTGPSQSPPTSAGGKLSAASLSGSSNEILQLIGQIEQYEVTRTAGDAEVVATSLRAMVTAQDAQARQLADKVTQQYRFPNLRIVMTEQLADRILPQPHAQESEVDDWIQGAQILGMKTVFTTLKARLVPDPQRFHLLLVADGVVDSQTEAHAGPAVFQNEGQTTFQVYSPIIMSPFGLKQGEVVAEANATNDVVGVSTDYDRILLFSSIARAMALKKQGQQQSAALLEVEEKVTEEARKGFQTQLEPKIAEGVKQFQQKVWQPLVRLNLNPTPVEMFTTRERMVSRILVGNEQQLAAHTPRPRAPSDSLASMQIHESLLNNALEQFKLDGQTLSLPELHRRISKELSGTIQPVPETLPTNVRIKFAAKDAVRVRFTDGQVELVLTLDEVRKGQDRWHNLVVKAYYAPEGTGLNAQLVRTDSIELKGENLNASSQIALRGAFSKLLSRSRTVSLVPSRLANDPRLKDLEVTQYELRDGWIGVAIGPQIAQRTTETKPVPRWRLSRDEDQSTRR
ncbi:MAG: hypothetical protein K8T91_23100, partial [Planctomycetes bacterium]|nr:hypothetical protein [Planctomycetota bacterium]